MDYIKAWLVLGLYGGLTFFFSLMTLMAFQSKKASVWLAFFVAAIALLFFILTVGQGNYVEHYWIIKAVEAK